MNPNLLQNPSAAADAAVRNADRLGEQAHAGIDRMTGTAHNAVERAASAVSSVADRVASSGEHLMHAQEEWMDTARVYVREHPVAALGIALSVGYVLSRLTSR